MTLRNAFANLATEPKQDGVIGYLREILRAAQYARTSADQMRVVVDSSAAAPAWTGTGTARVDLFYGVQGTAPAWYGNGSPNSMDLREQQMMASNANLGIAMQRWTVG
jgi:hypothetical protein